MPGPFGSGMFFLAVQLFAVNIKYVQFCGI